jgi:hypothetical protein
MVVDSHVDTFPACTSMAITSVSRDSMADATNPTELLHVEVK